MIRVVWRWEVDPEQRRQFVAAWRAATERIRSEEPGDGVDAAAADG
jgi:hypothetical protein